MKYREINLLGGFYKDASLPWSSQDTVNWLPVPAQAEGTRSPMKLRGVPGLSDILPNPVPVNGGPFVVSNVFPGGQLATNGFSGGGSGLPPGTPVDLTAVVLPPSGSKSAVFSIQCDETRGNAQVYVDGTLIGFYSFENTTPTSAEFSVAFPISPGQVVRVVFLLFSTIAASGSYQARVNYYAQTVEQLGLPQLPTTGGLGVIRGLRNVEGALFVVAGDSLIRIQNETTASYLGTIPGVGRVSMDYNQVAGGNQLAIDNGFSRYVYNTADQTLQQVTDDQFPGSFVAEFLDGYLLGVEPFGRYWFWSDLADGLSYSSFDRAQAEARPDPIIALKVFNREAWVFGRDTTEVFVNTGALTGTFQRASGTVMNVGCAGRFAVALSSDGLFWLGGDGRFYAASGYNPQPISTAPVEQAIRGLDWSQCYAMVWEDEGHSVVYFGFPNGVTFGFDASTGMWHRRESEGLPGWRVGHLERWNGKWIAGDIYGGGLFELAWDAYDEAGDPLVCMRTSGVFADSQHRMIFSGLELVMDTGSGDANQKAVLQYSDDGGRNWTNWREGSIGALGAYTKRIRFHRLGSSRNRVFRVRVSDPRRRDLLSASLSVESTGQ